MMPLITLRSSTRGTPCESGKNGVIRAIWASDSKIISVMVASLGATSESATCHTGKQINGSRA
jgi:hypothetical protein